MQIKIKKGTLIDLQALLLCLNVTRLTLVDLAVMFHNLLSSSKNLATLAALLGEAENTQKGGN
jgi:hypothetical protein